MVSGSGSGCFLSFSLTAFAVCEPNKLFPIPFQIVGGALFILKGAFTLKSSKEVGGSGCLKSDK